MHSFTLKERPALAEIGTESQTDTTGPTWQPPDQAAQKEGEDWVPTASRSFEDNKYVSRYAAV